MFSNEYEKVRAYKIRSYQLGRKNPGPWHHAYFLSEDSRKEYNNSLIEADTFWEAETLYKDKNGIHYRFYEGVYREVQIGQVVDGNY